VNIVLNEVEARVLGALLEKEITTPDYYPLSLNALVDACNQKSNRDPVMNLDEDSVRGALRALHDNSLARSVSAADSRVTKYEHRLPETLAGSEILALGKAHPDPFTTVRPEVKYRVRACTRYAVEENQRIETFIELARGAKDGLVNDAFRLMGDLMFQSHWSYTECGLGCDETDLLVELVRQECGKNQLYGAKITGGGAGGTVACKHRSVVG